MGVIEGLVWGVALIGVIGFVGVLIGVFCGLIGEANSSGNMKEVGAFCSKFNLLFLAPSRSALLFTASIFSEYYILLIYQNKRKKDTFLPGGTTLEFVGDSMSVIKIFIKKKEKEGEKDVVNE